MTVSARTWSLTLIAMVAFAANSLLCREALRHTATDAASFTFVRIISGALVLALVEAQRGRRWRPGGKWGGNWGSALALIVYAATFSFAYRSLTAGNGALLLFGAVQVTMISHGLLAGERLRPVQAVGLILAIVGLVMLLLPGISAPEPVGTMLMVSAGIAWGLYSLRGRSESDAVGATAGNFMRAVPLAGAIAATVFLTNGSLNLDGLGFVYAALSGAMASGLGYALWYTVLPSLPATLAATVQLSVPVIAAAAGVTLLGESVTLRLVASSLAVLGGIAVVIARRR